MHESHMVSTTPCIYVIYYGQVRPWHNYRVNRISRGIPKHMK